MGVERHEDGGFTVTGPDIEILRRLTVASALALEVNTGMVLSRGSAMQAANKISGSTKRTKKGALKDLVAYLETTITGYQPSASVRRALEK